LNQFLSGGIAPPAYHVDVCPRRLKTNMYRPSPHLTAVLPKVINKIIKNTALDLLGGKVSILFFSNVWLNQSIDIKSLDLEIWHRL